MKTRFSAGSKWSLSAGLGIGLALIVLLVLVAPSQAGVAAVANGTNLVANAGFEDGTASWTCRQCTLSAGAPAQSGAAAGQMLTTNRTGRGQLFQSNISLQPATTYELSFWAKSDGRDLQVMLQQQVSPKTNYGLNKTFDLTTEWQQFSITFASTGFANPVNDARLRLLAPKGKGFAFSIDDVSLVALDGPPPTDTPTPGPTATATATTPPGGGDSQITVFHWDDPITTKEHGFPWDKPPVGVANSNWKLSPHYDQGTMWVRGKIINARSPQIDMKIQFCIWQDNSALENCTKTYELKDQTGAEVIFSVPVQNLWKKNGDIIDWSRDRNRNGISIKTLQGQPVSDYSGWNWNGENPADWYPMDACFSVVVVAPGESFGGFPACN